NQEGKPFLIHPTGRLQNKSTEAEGLPLKPFVVLTVLAQTVVVGRGGRVEVLAGVRGRDSHIHRQAFGILPAGQGDVPGRRPGRLESPRMPLFSRTGERRPSSATLATKLRCGCGAR